MLKSLKYELKNNYKDFLISYIIMLVAFFILGFFLFFIRNVQIVNTFLSIVYINLVMVVFLAMTGSFIVFVINVIKGCYNKIFSDEGYLTLSLPITTNQLIISKILANIIWALLYFIAFMLGFIIIFFAIGDSPQEILAIIKGFVTDFFENIYLLPFGLLNSLLSLILGLIILILSFCLINLTTLKKGKIILGIIIYSGISSAVQIILSFTELLGFGFILEDGKFKFVTGMHANFLNNPLISFTSNGYIINFTFIIVMVLLIIGGYFLIKYLLEKKIEIE